MFMHTRRHVIVIERHTRSPRECLELPPTWEREPASDAAGVEKHGGGAGAVGHSHAGPPLCPYCTGYPKLKLGWAPVTYNAVTVTVWWITPEFLGSVCFCPCCE
jgi:hypothetical protein